MMRMILRPSVRVLLCGWIMLSRCALWAEGAPKRLLFLLPNELSQPDALALVRGMQSVFATEIPGQVDLSPEFVEGSEEEGAWLTAKYSRRPPDLILTYPRGPLRAALRLRERAQPAPQVLLFMNVDSPYPQAPEGAWIHRIEYQLSQFESIAVALKLLPGTRNIAYIGGGTVYDREVALGWFGQIAARWPSFGLIDLSNLPIDELRKRVSQLPPHTIAFLSVYNADARGLPITRRTLAADLAPRANAPLFDIQDDALGAGIVGGWLRDMEKAGSELALKAVQLVRNEPMDPVVGLKLASKLYRFDGRQLRRWGIDEKLLPEGSSVEFRESTFWQSHWHWMVGGAAIYALLTGWLIRLVRQRRKRQDVEAELREQAEFEAILADTSRALVNRKAFFSERDPLRQAMERFRQLARLSRVTLFFVRQEGGVPKVYRFSSPEFTGPENLMLYQHLISEIAAGREVRIGDVRKLPSPDREALLTAGTRAVLIVPVRLFGHQCGGISLVDTTGPRDWTDETAARARRIGEAAGAVWAYAVAEDDLNRSGSLSQAILASHEGYVVALDRDGTVLHANDPTLSRTSGTGLAPVTAGMPYEAVWSGLSAKPAKILDGVAQVLAGERSEMEDEIETGERWIRIHAIPLLHDRGGAVVTHVDITGPKRAALRGSHDLGQVSHSNRLSALGELASSLAHEISQPLSAILANADSAHAILSMPQPDLPELGAAVADIQSDGRRAASVIRDMRALLRKNSSAEPAPVDLSAVVTDTVRLVENDAAQRRVRVDLQLCCGGAVAAIGRTQFQQVLLNLLSNALDAAAAAPEGIRSIVLRTHCEGGHVVVEVADNGPGVPPGDREKIFEPFMTTKSEGLGVGLSISRSIVTRAGGVIELVDSEAGGATFRVKLPVARAAAGA